MEDFAGLQQDPRIQALLKGAPLHLVANVHKISGRKLKPRVLALTETALLDLDATTLKCVHRLPIDVFGAYSVDTTPDSDGLILYVDRATGATTKDLVLVAPQRDAIVARLCDLFQNEMQRQLRATYT